MNADHVVELANAALDGMRTVMTVETTAVELLSAQLSILARLLQVLREMGVDERTLWSAVEQVLVPRTVALLSKTVH